MMKTHSLLQFSANCGVADNSEVVLLRLLSLPLKDLVVVVVEVAYYLSSVIRSSSNSRRASFYCFPLDEIPQFVSLFRNKNENKRTSPSPVSTMTTTATTITSLSMFLLLSPHQVLSRLVVSWLLQLFLLFTCHSYVIRYQISMLHDDVTPRVINSQ